MNQITADIMKYVQQCGGNYEDWYVGIAAYPDKSLFIGHNVSEKYDSWIYRSASTNADAKEIQHLLLMMGFDGNPKRNDSSGKNVYVYKKAPYTEE